MAWTWRGLRRPWRRGTRERGLFLGLGVVLMLVPFERPQARPILPPPPRAVDLTPLTTSTEQPLTLDQQALFDLAGRDGDLLLEEGDARPSEDFAAIHVRGITAVLAHHPERLDTRWPELGDEPLAGLFHTYAPHVADVAAAADRLFPRLRERELSRTGAEMTAAIWLVLRDYGLLRERWVATGRGGLDELDGPAIEDLLGRVERGELGVGLLPPTLLSFRMGFQPDISTVLIPRSLADDPTSRDVLDSCGGVPIVMHELLHASQHYRGMPPDRVGAELDAYVFAEKVRILNAGAGADLPDFGFNWENWTAEDLEIEGEAAVERWLEFVDLASRIQELVGASLHEMGLLSRTIARREILSGRAQTALRARWRDAYVPVCVVLLMGECLLHHLMDSYDEASLKEVAAFMQDAGLLQPVAVTREAAIEAWPREPQTLEDEITLWLTALALQVTAAWKLADAEQLDRFLELELAPVLRGELASMVEQVPAFGQGP